MDRNNGAGFTLIELVIVLAILAALAAIAVPRLISLQARVEMQSLASELAGEAQDSFVDQIRKDNDWPYIWRADQTGTSNNGSSHHICDALDNPTSNLAGYDTKIPAGYKVVPANDAPAEAVTFTVPNASGGSKSSTTASVTCAVIEDI